MDTELRKCRNCGEEKNIDRYNNGGRTCRVCIRIKVKLKKVTLNPERYIWMRAKDNAKKCNREFNIDEGDIIIPEHCPMLGIKLSYEPGSSVWTSPSLDRIDNSKGYIKGNVVVISFKANRIKGQLTNKELLMVAKYIMLHIKE